MLGISGRFAGKHLTMNTLLTPNSPNLMETATLDQISAFFKELQDNICNSLEALDASGTKFQQDLWDRPEGGGGRTRVFEGGALIEKGGVNFSHVHGPMPEKISSRLGLPTGEEFHATGVSIVLHPVNPFVPIIHSNVRYFQMGNGAHWFGGGIDVTPAYIYEDQAIAFHQHMKEVCDDSDPSYYSKFKAWADEYFYLKHRDETRGIGGIFFDHMKTEKEKNWKFVQAVGQAFVPAYTALAEANRNKSYGEAEIDWQMRRRSRYVEFNLVHDKGTKFGLDTGGRTESILMSMPPMAKWDYNHKPAPGSPEAATQALLRPIDWLKLS